MLYFLNCPSIGKKIFYRHKGQVSNNGHPNGRDIEKNNKKKKKERKSRRIVQIYVVMSSILSGILLLNVIKIFDNLYISPSHVSVLHLVLSQILFIYFLWKNQFGQGQLKMLFFCYHLNIAKGRHYFFQSRSIDLKWRTNAPTMPSPTLVLLTFTLDPPSSLAWLDMNELMLEDRKTIWNCLSEISFYLSQGNTANSSSKSVGREP